MRDFYRFQSGNPGEGAQGNLLKRAAFITNRAYATGGRRGHGLPLFCEASSFKAAGKGEEALAPTFASFAPPSTFKFVAQALTQGYRCQVASDEGGRGMGMVSLYSTS